MEDDSLLESFSIEWVETNRVVFGEIPNTYEDKYYSIFRKSLVNSDVYYYKSSNKEIGIISSFVRVVQADKLDVTQFMDLVVRMYSPEVKGVISGDDELDFHGWQIAGGCSDLQLTDSNAHSAIVAANYNRLTKDHYDEKEVSDVQGERNTIVSVFASSWKVKILTSESGIDKGELKRFFAGKIIPRPNSAYGFWVYECLFTMINSSWKLLSISKEIHGNADWIKNCLSDVLPEIRVVRVEYGPSNKTYEQFIELTARPDVMNYVADGKPWTRNKSTEIIVQAQQDSISDTRNYHHWFLVDSQDNLLCYIAVLYKRSQTSLESEVRIISRVPRKGYARRAVIFVSNFFQATAGDQHSLKARVNRRNEASVRLFDSLYPSWKRTDLLFGVIHYKLDRKIGYSNDEAVSDDTVSDDAMSDDELPDVMDDDEEELLEAVFEQ